VLLVSPTNLLGEYLRARREQLRPGDVGLPDHGRRRTPGLRREELAQLAGISSDYYVRLEQGRDQHPSTQVLDALAVALQLDEDSTLHLHTLGRPPGRRRSAAARSERVSPGLTQLIASWRSTPAVVQGRLGTVLTSNALARALSPMYEVGANPIRAVFLDPAVRALYGESWEQVTQTAVAGMRAFAGAHLDHPQLVELVGELSLGSDRFRQLWARHDVRARNSSGRTRMAHPQVGPLDLRHEKLTVAGTDQTLVIFHADPGSSSAQALALLETLAADPSPVESESTR